MKNSQRSKQYRRVISSTGRGVQQFIRVLCVQQCIRVLCIQTCLDHNSCFYVQYYKWNPELVFLDTERGMERGDSPPGLFIRIRMDPH
jgi:hypothetical protein